MVHGSIRTGDSSNQLVLGGKDALTLLSALFRSSPGKHLVNSLLDLALF